MTRARRSRFAYYSYFSGVPLAGIEVYLRPGERMHINFPTNDDLSCIAIQAPIAGFPAFRADIEGNFFRAIARTPQLAERVRAGRREERWYGTADLANFFRTPHGPGWALVGDAGYHKDPVTAQGITDAFRDAELLAEAVRRGILRARAAGRRAGRRMSDGGMRRRCPRTRRRAGRHPSPRSRRRYWHAARRSAKPSGVPRTGEGGAAFFIRRLGDG